MDCEVELYLRQSEQKIETTTTILFLVLVLAPRGFSLSSKTNIPKFQFDLDYCQALYHEPLALEIA